MRKDIKYRPEIDGLRAIAVFSVIFYHSVLTIFEKKFLPGGFIGVDIFFVISGYLITKIILNEIEKTRKFSFLNFYKRRIRRIIPALFFVIILTFPFIYYKTLPFFFIDYVKSILSIIFFVSNFYFWGLGIGYDQLQNIQFQPFLHAWTLSLEEQFYLFFPIVFILIYKKLNKKLNLLIVIGFFSSIFFADYMSYAHASVNFYSLPTRAWEFLAGSILIIIEKKKFKFILTGIYNSYFIYLGIFFIIYSLIFFNDKMFLPSLITLIPILGTSLIILYKIKKNLLIKIFSSKLFVGIGLISYSLYLWHFPIFIIFPNFDLLLQLILIFFLSIFSYFFIEKNFRKKVSSNFYSMKTIIISGVLIFVVAIISLQDGNKNNFSEYPKIIKKTLNEKGLIKLSKNLDFTDKFNKNKTNLFITGDSHMFMLAKYLKSNKKIKEYNFIPQTLSGGCYYVNNFDKINYFTKKKKTVCTKENQAIRKSNFLKKENSIVIIGGRLPLYLNDVNLKFSRYFDKKSPIYSGDVFVNSKNILLKDGIRNSIYELLENNTKVILIYPVPILNFDPVKKISDRYMHNKFLFEENLVKNPLTVPLNSFLYYVKQSHELLDSINHPNLYRIYTHKIFCDSLKNKCNAHDEESIFYRDNNHLSRAGNNKVIALLFEKLELIKNSMRDKPVH